MAADNLSPLLIPRGTQVVVRENEGESRYSGAVGVIVYAPADPTHRYRVRFPDGTEASFRRKELELRKHLQRAGLEQGNGLYEDYAAYIIYRCVVGSRAFGLSQDDSDIDRRGIYLPPANWHWSLWGVPEQIERPESEEAYWELQKFLGLALKANPNILECLYTPLVEYASPLAQELLALREAFLSKLVYQTYNGYVMSQFKKMERDLRNKGQIKTKHAMHLIRLLLAGIAVLREGHVPVDVGVHRESLLAIRRGEMSWEVVNEWRRELHAAFDEAYRQTGLPERPDYACANAFLLRARRSMVEEANSE
jgi:uncharacterized protein